MGFIPTRIHGILDYLLGALLIAAPWLFGFAQGGAETLVPSILGASVILYSFFTDYELGAVKTLSVSGHLWLDLLGGALLAVSPWLFNFVDVIIWPHFTFGVLETLVALFTRRLPSYRQGQRKPVTP